MNKALVAAAVLVLDLSFAIQAQSTNPPNTKPDNTKVNERDRHDGALTADQQDGKADTDLTRRVRQAIVKDKALSTYAHNVKIVTQGGVVTLRGPVRSDDEKQAVATLATQVAGAGHVRNELEISMEQKGK
jgi:hyperosmotically inducible periplasmic protein